MEKQRPRGPGADVHRGRLGEGKGRKGKRGESGDEHGDEGREEEVWEGSGGCDEGRRLLGERTSERAGGGGARALENRAGRPQQAHRAHPALTTTPPRAFPSLLESLSAILSLAESDSIYPDRDSRRMKAQAVVPLSVQVASCSTLKF